MMASRSRGSQLADPLPNFPTNTVFIAVCGSVSDDCGSDKDGWFFSHVYLMYEMFRSLGARRRFYTTVEPNALFDKHDGRVLHGNSKQARKNVLSFRDD